MGLLCSCLQMSCHNECNDATNIGILHYEINTHADYLSHLNCSVFVEEELCRKVHIQTRAQEILRNSSAPIENPTHTSSLEPSCVQRTKKEMLAFLDEKPTFQPKINPQVPDFSRLHKDSQAEALQRAKRKDVTKCRPFHLRTSTLPARKCGMSPETSQVHHCVGPLPLTSWHCVHYAEAVSRVVIAL